MVEHVVFFKIRSGIADETMHGEVPLRHTRHLRAKNSTYTSVTFSYQNNLRKIKRQKNIV